MRPSPRPPSMRGAAPAVAAAFVVAAAVLTPPRPAYACGPDFDIELLADRAGALDQLEDGIFLDEAARLMPPPAPAFVSMVGADGTVDPAAEGAAEHALYALGAAEFRADHPDAAERAFEQLLALPPAARRARSTWAAYMLGRLRTGMDADNAGAIAAYRQVRALAEAGFRDDGGLALSSLGQEARLVATSIAAVHLYAEQAARGHPDGGTSLLFVVRALIERGAEAEIVTDPVGQRLLAAYLWSRADELDDTQRARLWAALLARPALAGADRLAAAAYRNGDVALARELASRADDTPVARRVRAKLALRAGDTATAEALLVSIDDGSSPRICGDRAVLAAGVGRFTDAMERAWAVRARYPDAVYLAERVLTLDELSAFVATLPPPARASDGRWVVDTVTMRGILGRRLMRAERFAEAIPYLALEHVLHAATYAGAIERARATTDDITRAEALYDASRLARRHGLEILGTAHAPDWETHHGDYDLSEYMAEVDPGRWLTDEERRRVAASAPDRGERWHYRHVASRLAEQAADLLPRQSQAYAATMCWSARHVRHVDDERVQDLYARYLDEGPAVSMSFGHDCPEPAFARARRFIPLGPAPVWQLVLTAVVCAIGAILLWRRMRPRVTPRP